MVQTKVRVEEAQRPDRAVRKGSDAYLKDLAGTGFEKSQEIIAREATDTGQLLRSGFQPEKLRDGTYQWGYAADYAEHVDQGQEPHFPPVEALRGWARRVLGDESAAWGVAKKIAEEGVEPVNFIERSLSHMNDWAATHNMDGYIVKRL